MIHLSFTVLHEGCVHGLGGYFDCDLFQQIGFSTVPETRSPDMFSWFPMFIPFQEPFTVVAGDELRVTFWRCVHRQQKMWYEWMVLRGDGGGKLQNSCGKSFSVLL